MGTTPVLLLPYPAASDPADVPLDMQELADRIEAVRGATNGLASLDSTGKVPAAQLPTAAAAPGTELAYAQITTTVSVTATAEASSTTIVTAAAVTFDGVTACMVEFYSPQLLPPSGTSSMNIDLWDGSTNLGRFAALSASGIQPSNVPCMVARRLTPSAASHTFSVRGWGSATSQVAAGVGGSGAFSPAWIRITRV